MYHVDRHSVESGSGFGGVMLVGVRAWKTGRRVVNVGVFWRRLLRMGFGRFGTRASKRAGALCVTRGTPAKDCSGRSLARNVQLQESEKWHLQFFRVFPTAFLRGAMGLGLRRPRGGFPSGAFWLHLDGFDAWFGISRAICGLGVRGGLARCLSALFVTLFRG